MAIIRRSIELQPFQRVSDLVKLVYQNEFGGGHLVEDERTSLVSLESEIFALRNHPQPATGRFTPLGNDLCRIHLAGLDRVGISASTINRLFIGTANQVRGKAQRFKYKLLGLREYLDASGKQLDVLELDRFLDSYDFSSCPPPRHSALYRELEAPSYRIVSLDAWFHFELFARLDQLLRKRDAANLGIDGPCGSGKSRLASLLQFVYAAQIISMDHFFLPSHLRTEHRLQEVGGNVDYERFLVEVADPLAQALPFTYNVFNCQTMRLDDTVSINPGRLNIVEGSYSLHPRFRDLYHLSVFLAVDRDLQIQRIMERNGQERLCDFTNKWMPMEDLYFEQLQIALHSDLVLEGDKEGLLIQWLEV